MAITYIKNKNGGWTSHCGDCIGYGKTPIDAIFNAHQKWWDEHEEEVMNPTEEDNDEPSRK